ncbi:DUF4861 family protein [Alteromonas sp. AMM-1]|uniref:DUF4861 family protein n=1 Tax=Alteromonas sp. AMM-1 TaxID=3394233 RepID=UPI0039A55BAE
MNRTTLAAIIAASISLTACNKSPETVKNSVTSAEPVQRTHAELSVRQGGAWEGQKYVADNFTFEPVTAFTSPAQLTDHSYYLRYEGPGWENDLVGYRLYLDWRNGIDVFVKTTSDMVLSKVGQDGYDSYHELSDWGGDALKVGKSVGLGALGRWVVDNVEHFKQVNNTHWSLLKDGGDTSEFEVRYEGWDVAGVSADVTTHYQINAGDPSTLVTVTSSVPLDNLVTGLVRHDNVNYIEKHGEHWTMIATYGKQNLLGDEWDLGLALFVKNDQIAEQFEGPHDYLFKFVPQATYQYGFFATWQGHPEQPQTQQEFEAFMEDKLKRLDAATNN